ncbi:MAG: polysaccharide deacetylase family protein [Proteobacteria bacterium]|jgi:allantoinase|nr:polysaccharide deacetylase family protein [Pseudomonadota bacterium]
MKSPRERLPYSPIVDRPPLKLPGGARMVVWTIMNVEHWDSTVAQPRTILPPPMGKPLLPDVPNWSWHEYGNRVGFWRLRDLFNEYGVTPTLAMNGTILESYPRIAEEALKHEWEFMGHGFIQSPMHKLDNQAEHIQRTIDAIKSFTGKPPTGWESPGLTETMETLDLLSKAGIEYVADWPLDDQPVELKTASGKKVYSIPYPVETNDIPIMILQQHSSEEFAKRCIDQFDRLYEESAEITRIMGISMHTYVSGAPHRYKYVEQVYKHITSKPDVLIWTGEQVIDWYKTQI